MILGSNYKHLISLGFNCFPRIFIDHCNLHSKYPIRMPFDGMICSYDFLYNSLSTNFTHSLEGIQHNKTNYFDKSALVIKQSNKNVAEWSHEPSYEINTFIINFNKRVQQFNDVLSRKNEPVMFLMHFFRDPFALDAIELIATVLKNRYPKLHFHIFVLNIKNIKTSKIQSDYITYHALPFDPPEFKHTPYITCDWTQNEIVYNNLFSDTLYSKEYRNNVIKQLTHTCKVS